MTVKDPETKVPADLRRVLASSAKAKTQWIGLTQIGRRDFITWIESAKQEETRKRRVLSVPSRLASGKKRPCCFAIVPMNLYKALGESPKAKKTWSSLSASEKRDYVDWVESPKEKNAREIKIAKACAMLARGVRHP